MKSHSAAASVHVRFAPTMVSEIISIPSLQDYEDTSSLWYSSSELGHFQEISQDNAFFGAEQSNSDSDESDQEEEEIILQKPSISRRRPTLKRSNAMELDQQQQQQSEQPSSPKAASNSRRMLRRSNAYEF